MKSGKRFLTRSIDDPFSYKSWTAMILKVCEWARSACPFAGDKKAIFGFPL